MFCKTPNYPSLSHKYKLQKVKNRHSRCNSNIFISFYLFPGWYFSSCFLLTPDWEWTKSVPKLHDSQCSSWRLKNTVAHAPDSCSGRRNYTWVLAALIPFLFFFWFARFVCDPLLSWLLRSLCLLFSSAVYHSPFSILVCSIYTADATKPSTSLASTLLAESE